MQFIKLKEITDIRLGYSLQKALSADIKGNIRIIQPKDIDEFNCIDFSDVWSTTISPNPVKHFINNGEVLLISRGKFRAAVYKPPIGQNFAVSSSFLRIILNSSVMIPEYVATYLNSFAGYRELAKMQSCGSGIAAINADELKNLKIPIPSLSKQKKIAELSNERLNMRKLQKKHTILLDKIFDYVIGEH